MQRVLDCLPYSPAMVRTATRDVFAWNTAAVVLAHFSVLEPHEHNILRLLFSDARAKQVQQERESVTQFGGRRVPCRRRARAPAMK
ncbi:hypothetical protein [Dyella amyloliquefaciens]|uniref:MmyB family transcriptional regulator n=1 Tax=Dyella amyloliquefaciens TaxID=1770545 RepID=UPI0022771DDA|nr:hypothetical protein [Dyella amyloliquefaciens]